MTDRPIIFSGPMVRALLEGRKTQTRRLATSPLRRAVVGDRLWVRECFAEVGNEGHLIVTRADYPTSVPPQYENLPTESAIKWRPSIHMPRRASRLTLVVTDVRFELVRAITPEDAIAEGVERAGLGWKDYQGESDSWKSPTMSYGSLWASLHGTDSWEANPEVVALEFEVEHTCPAKA